MTTTVIRGRRRRGQRAAVLGIKWVLTVGVELANGRRDAGEYNDPNEAHAEARRLRAAGIRCSVRKAA
jgi:hypothetical protein